MEETPKVQRDVNLARFTTFGIGGSADYFVVPKSANELQQAIEWAESEDYEWFVLGSGANILFGDGGFRGVVIKNEAKHFEFKERLLKAESGATIAELIDATTKRGLSGLEHYKGIPSTVGGAMWQNLHFLSYPHEQTRFISEIVEGATILADGERRHVTKEYFRFGYDTSVLHDNDHIVLEVTFTLEESTPEDVEEVAVENLAWRRRVHPANAVQMSAGSIFRKIKGVGAGRLIDQCGLKGHRIGGAEVSDHHANYILNVENATAEDVRKLIEHVQKVVKEKTGYALEPEISFVGDF
ncbi:MAG: UDP-N-acetylmuramate dehydrogenase [bacterium]|nr:UDP-N-acetylmuramate dehydrogenase [bacterium]MDZ4248341.1 UDP-N-acetylmuramate dehydrogenase [Patescibacteria group bacterium]